MSAGQLLVEDTPLNLKRKYAVGFTFVCSGADRGEIEFLTGRTIPEGKLSFSIPNSR